MSLHRPPSFRFPSISAFFFCRSAPLSRLVPRVQQYFGSRALGIKLTVTIPTSAKVSVSRATYLPKKLRKAPQKVPGSTKSYPYFQQCSFCFNLLFCGLEQLGPWNKATEPFNIVSSRDLVSGHSSLAGYLDNSSLPLIFQTPCKTLVQSWTIGGPLLEVFHIDPESLVSPSLSNQFPNIYIYIEICICCGKPKNKPSSK